jgi:hypothetical protein
VLKRDSPSKLVNTAKDFFAKDLKGVYTPSEIKECLMKFENILPLPKKTMLAELI